ncbi:MAG: uroporphyrinogen-III synthase [Rhodospirillaceae bacterium]|nr:uroporphyrinogen-III synthase [Rhodospirillaceae bacterium]
MLVTQSAEDADAAVAALRSRGHDVLAVPLITAERPLPPKVNLSSAQGFLVTSAEGARALADNVGVRTFPVFADGEVTAAALRKLGFKDVHTAKDDSADLAKLVERTLKPANGALIYASSTAAAINLPTMLSNMGFAVRPLPLYSIKRVDHIPAALREALQNNALDAALFLTPDEARAFVTLVQRDEVEPLVRKLTAVAATPVVAAPLRALKLGAVSVPDVANLDALFDAFSGTFVDRVEEERLERERRAKEAADAEAAKEAERQRIAAEEAARMRAEQDRIAREKAAREQAERERLEQERRAKEQAERDKAEQERVERERRAAEKAEQERIAREKAAALKAAREKAAAEQAERDRIERERIAAEKAERDRIAAEKVAALKAEREKAAAEQAERDRMERERLTAEKAARDRIAQEAIARAKSEQERLALERAEHQRQERERLAAEKAEQDRVARAKAAAEKAERERLAEEQAERDRAERERRAAEKAEADRLAREKAATEKAARERIAAEQAERDRVESERLAAEKTERERIAREKAVADKAERARLAAEAQEQKRAERERQTAEKVERQRLEREAAAAAKAERQRLRADEKAQAAAAKALEPPRESLGKRLGGWLAKRRPPPPEPAYTSLWAMQTEKAADTAPETAPDVKAAVLANTPSSVTMAPAIAAPSDLGEPQTKEPDVSDHSHTPPPDMTEAAASRAEGTGESKSVPRGDTKSAPLGETKSVPLGGGRAARLLAEDAADLRAKDQRFKYLGHSEPPPPETDSERQNTTAAPMQNHGGGGIGRTVVLFLVLVAMAGAVMGTASWWVPRVTQMVKSSPPPATAPDAGATVQTDIAALKARVGVLEQEAVNTVTPDALNKAKAELTQRLAALEGRPAGAEDGAVTSLGDSVSSQAKQLAAVSARLATLEAAIGNSARLEDLSKRLNMLEGRSAEAHSVLALSDRVTALETTARRTMVEQSSNIALLMAVSQWREALLAGHPFALELQTTKALAARIGDVAIDDSGFADIAARGVPTLAELQRQFGPAAAAAMRASAVPDGTSAWYRRILDRVLSIVTVRRLDGDAAGMTTAAVLARAENRLNTGDLAAAVAEMDNLTGAAASAAQAWQAPAKARAAAERAAADVATKAVAAVAAAGKAPENNTPKPTTSNSGP